MSEMKIRQGSLVLYKGRPARIKQIADKIEIVTDQQKSLKVRPKDIDLLHPGPIESLQELRQQAGEVKTAWELLAGGTTTLAELAELAFGDYTPATAWATWQLVDDGLYFRGEPGAVIANSAEEVAEEQAARAARTAEARAWAEFLQRASNGEIIPEDERYLREVEEVAVRQRDKSRMMQALGHTQTAENAHALLLKLGYWDHTVNPYPRRLGLSTDPPSAELPALPEEARRDLTHLSAFAIDDEDSRDPDDALSLEHNRLWVHIADVAALIPAGSPADQKAQARGATLYLPEKTITMLPPRATEQLALGLTEVSPALSFGLDLDDEGEIVGVEVVPSWVKVQRRSYAEVETRLAEEPFRSLHRLAQHHLSQRNKNGAINIDLPEVNVRVKDGQVVIRPLPALKSRDLVREAMLMAGRAAARFAIEHDIPFPFATQEASDETPEVTEGLAGMVALRRTMKRSQMKSTPGPHAGLGLDSYVQATSPLRRYLDLVVHQQLRAYLKGDRLLDSQDILERVGAAESIIGSVRQAERLAQKHWTLVYLLQHPNWRGEGVLVEKRGRRARILIPELDLEVYVRLRGDLPLNSAVPLLLGDVDLPALDAHFLS